MKNIFFVIIGLATTVIGAVSFHYYNKLPQPEHALYYQQARALIKISWKINGR